MSAEFDLAPYIAAIDDAFAGIVRPEHFADHDHCCECADNDTFFQQHTPQSLAELSEPAETLPIAFLTDGAFLYFMPAFARMLARGGSEYSADTILLFVELRLHLLDDTQREAIRDLLYAAYEKIGDQIHATAFDYPAVSRILAAIEGT